MTERLTACALIRDGETHSRGLRAHWEIRYALGDKDPSRKNPSDECGFMTSEGRFVFRDEAVPIAVAAGQISDRWLSGGRELLSSDINWDAAPVVKTSETRQQRRARERRSASA